MTSVPALTQFDPNQVPWQLPVIRYVRQFDYSKSILEVMLSGSVGSAKTLLMAHLGVTHCLSHPGAHLGIGRVSTPQLRDTLLQMIVDHIGNDVDYEINLSRGTILFPNGSRITPISWGDKRYSKLRSYAFSAFLIEELTENKDDKFYKELKARVGRIPSVPESFIIAATNPDSPAHWAYKYFIENEAYNRKTFYSLTEQNRFLPPSYIQGLKETYSAREADRMLRGKWVELSKDHIYGAYSREHNFRDFPYTFDKRHPIDFFHDWNIGYGKPMSMGIGQWTGTYHIAKDFIIEGSDTNDLMDEILESGYLDQFPPRTRIRIFGDATGKNRDTRSKRSDFDIVVDRLQKAGFRPELCVATKNPPIRKRHNVVNAKCMNDNGKAALFVYQDAPTVDEGMRLTSLKQGAQYIEDDTQRYQHITTAVGYWILHNETKQSRGKSFQQSF